jgi:hypothetical protein
LSLSAPSSCTTASALLARVRLRSKRIEFVDEASGVPLLGVLIHARAKQQVEAQLTVLWPDGRRSERQLVDASCSQAVDALALLIALALDPTVQLGAATRDDSGPAQPATAASPREDQPSAAETRAPTDGPALPPSAADTRVPADAAAVAADEHASAKDADTTGAASLRVERFSVGLVAQLVGGAAPQLMPGFGAFALMLFGGSAPWSVLLQLEATHAFSAELSELGGHAKFQLDIARLDACPLGLPLGPLWARACLAGALGRLAARGDDTYSPASSARLWASLGALLLMTLELGSQIEIQTSAALYAPLRRDAYAFRPDVFYEAALLGLDLRLGVGLRFP